MLIIVYTMGKKPDSWESHCKTEQLVWIKFPCEILLFLFIKCYGKVNWAFSGWYTVHILMSWFCQCQPRCTHACLPLLQPSPSGAEAWRARLKEGWAGEGISGWGEVGMWEGQQACLPGKEVDSSSIRLNPRPQPKTMWPWLGPCGFLWSPPAVQQV